MRQGDGIPTVLLAEDEPLIGLDLCDCLHGAGFRVIGPAATSAEALALLAQERPQLAILDIRLKDGPCGGLMGQLRRLGVPFAIHSGYRREECTMADITDAPWLDKPASPQDIMSLLTRVRPAIGAS